MALLFFIFLGLSLADQSDEARWPLAAEIPIDVDVLRRFQLKTSGVARVIEYLCIYIHIFIYILCIYIFLQVDELNRPPA